MNLDIKISIIKENLQIEEKKIWEIFAKNKKTLLFFYPKDETPWCTLENIDFSKYKNDFLQKWIYLIWVSKDSIENHKKFIENSCLKNDLISDESLELHKSFWAFWEKNNYWKIILWVIRSTFLIDEKWNIIKSWKNVKAKWHVEKVLREI